MYSNPFPELRSAYLRSIARAWRDEGFKRRLLEAKNTKRGALSILEDEFGLEVPWDIKLIVALGNPGPSWRPNGTLGWIGIEDSFMLYVPIEDEPPEHPADVLARYYQERPTLLGRPTRPHEAAPSSFAEFGAATMRAVALAWEDATFRRQLLARDSAGKARDVKQLFENYLDHQVPWNFSLHFEAIAYPRNDAEWAALPPSEITVVLPQRPSPENGVTEAIALAAYNATGPQYPFTCG